MVEATAAAGDPAAAKGNPRDKVFPDAKTALDGIVADGQTLAVGGFGLCGIPEALIAALREAGMAPLEIRESPNALSELFLQAVSGEGGAK